MIAFLKGRNRFLHINVKEMRAANMQHILSEMHDFKYEKPQLQSKHRVLFIPQFHSELNLIKRCWVTAKKLYKAALQLHFPRTSENNHSSTW